MTVYSAWNQGRLEAAQKADRRPIRASILSVLIRVITMVATKLPIWKRVRTAIMQWAGFGFLTYAAFEWRTIAGFVVAGLSLLVLEALGGDRR